MRKKYAWIAAGSVTCIALGSATAWWLSRGPAPSAAAGEADQSAAARTNDPKLREAMALALDRSEDGYKKVIEAYARWAGDPGALPARNFALGVLFAEQAVGVKLKRVLEAVEADKTPPASDPLWPRVTEGLADLWTPETFGRGRDLMLMETRPRARQALIDSWTKLVDSDRLAKMSEQQRQLLVSDLLDLYPSAEPEQKPRIENTLRTLGGNDLAEIISGRGLEPGAKLEAHEQYERELQEALAKLPADPDTVAPPDDSEL
jgi:hypothetical protein